MIRSRALVLALGVLVCALGITTSAPAAVQHAQAAKKKKKHCKKTQKLRKGKCVPKPKAPVPAAPQPGPDPASDADGDGIPYAWETTTSSAPTTKCNSKQRLVEGRCVLKKKKCKKGKKLKRGKCVKAKAKKPGKRRGGKARASAIAPASVAPLGADPNHKDIFVQINYASASLRQSVACGELDAITAAFAKAPVSNPDGTTGIALHLDAGVNCPSRSYDLGGSQVFATASPCPGITESLLASQLPESRVGTFHVSAFVPTCSGGGGEGGVGDLHGDSSLVFTDGASFAHVLMHELGHNLGLDHPVPGAPNHLSTMNMRLQASATGSGSTERLDYQRFDLPALDENALSEAAGISAPTSVHDLYVIHWCAGESAYRYAWPGNGPIDWNCNSPSLQLPGEPPLIDPGPVAADVNGDGQLTVLPATHGEWSTLDYASGGKIGPR